MALEPGRKPAPSPAVKPPASRQWWVYAALGLASAFLLLRPGGAGTHVPYSDMKSRIASGQVAELAVSRDRLVAVPKDAALVKKGERWVSERVEDPELVPLLDKQHVTYTGVQESDWLSNLLFAWVMPIVLMAALWMFLLRRMGKGGGLMGGVMNIGRSRAKLLAEEGTGVTFRDVAGVDEAVDELKEVVDFLKTPERFRRIGGRIPKGVLLVGPPGTGKTLLARAVAGEAGVPFYSLTGSDFVEMFVGVGAARVRDLFAQAQQKAPCIIFIDELDAIGKARSAAGTFASHDEREQTLNQLLSEMDGFDARKGLIVMGATNRPEILDAALLRPGRFDRQVLVDRPDVKGRELILQVHAKDVRFSPSVDLRAIAAITPGLAGAELANIINEAALLAARRNQDMVTTAELTEAVERVVAGLEKKSRRMNPREKEIVAHHESGHAVLAEVLPTTDRVHKVSMIPRGMGALGYTMQVPLEDRYLLTRQEILDRITVLLGGRAAEMIVFGEISTGAQDDLERATELARRMVVQFGMSERIGPQSLVAPEGSFDARSMRGLGLTPERNFGERTQETIDAEIASILHDMQERALSTLEANRPQLMALAARLREREVLEGTDLREILVGLVPPAAEPRDDEHTVVH